MLEKKQNVFDDFIAAGEYLIAQKYTDRDHLAIEGGSNGGLLMGAMITQRPDLFRAVVCAVPLLDMLRYQNFQIAKLWVPEYGSADDPKQFRLALRLLALPSRKAGVEYPAILFMTGDTDTRVDPMHAKKMAALMQAEAKNGASKDSPSCCASKPKPDTARASRLPTNRREHGYVFVLILAVGGETVTLEMWRDGRPAPSHRSSVLMPCFPCALRVHCG